MHQLSLNVKNWVAWAPGIDSCDGWSDWTPEIGLKCLEETPEIGFVPAVVRRRLSTNSRLAIRVAHTCMTSSTGIASAVFCSRHGECKRTLNLFGALAKGEPLSPIQFSQSVHNTSAGVFSIERKLQVPVTSIAAGPGSGEQGFIEAVALVRAGLGPVLWVMSDDRQEAPFREFVATPDYPFAVAMIVGEFPDDPVLSLMSEQAASKSQAKVGTDNLLALLTGQDCFRIEGGNGWSWRWRD